VHQFLIVLTGATPLVWRPIQVPERYSFWDLHVAIQDAMGWLDYHLHEFRLLDAAGKQVVSIGIPTDEDPEDRPVLPGWEVRLSRFDNPRMRWKKAFGRKSTDGVFLDRPAYLPVAIRSVVVFNDEALLACVSAFDRFVFPSDVFVVEHAGDGRVNVAVLVLVFSNQHEYSHLRLLRRQAERQQTDRSFALACRNLCLSEEIVGHRHTQAPRDRHRPTSFV
jgi:hypothetical protein